MRAPAAVVFLSLLVVTFGSVLVLTNDQPRRGRTASVRRSIRRYLYNYSSSRSSSSSSSSSSNGNGGSSSYMNPNYAYDSSNPYGNSASSSSSSSSSSSNSGNSGNAYSNAASYNSQNSANQNYENENYVWQRDDDDDVYDSNENWDSNHSYKANGSGNYYNGRGSDYTGGQAVQQQADEDEAEVELVGADDSWLKALTLKEIVAVFFLVTITSLFLIVLLGYSGHVFDLWGMCCGHKTTVDETTTLGDTIEDGFVKIGDF
mmetsp:Transcript_51973/g.125319  ORF Transcript_51973/g.125319 Transcript_51973/m.125319 type:complete len:261 (-) Transcript_51973:280-1062(-)|eukprot:CAMPEP_0113445216 /NCGR_PEP_ID=MMETSP0014_2-20120614/3072_1 /TAXON_ID=2857 /ORGANISM="Nitzschia sp." /LENGTH=260 /DNA_ID=CAMNT_0000336261 /DNA_START=64 /DNA_END=846 /DNA_ORIENTATION=+ /assembly_acc=CAM_ASM_000159